MCNYTGNGGVEAFAVEPHGAAFKLVDQHDFFKPLSATDCEFGYDGRMYVSDFVGLDWSGKSKGGRMFTVEFPELLKDGRPAEVAKLVAQGFGKRSDEELLKLLGHFDQRVRLRAQFELAARGEKSIAGLQTVAEAKAEERLPRLARLHAIWGLGQIKATVALETIEHFLTDEDAEVRTQAAKVLGERKHDAAGPALVPLLVDESDRVKFHSAIALGQMKYRAAADKLWELAKSQDRYLRHAAVFALSKLEQNDSLRRKISDNDPSIRLAAALIYRRWADPAEVNWVERPAGKANNYTPELAQLLNDPELTIATEAARVINDFHLDRVNDALAARAEMIVQGTTLRPDALVRRVINANYRTGKPEHAANLARIAAAQSVSLPCRKEAIAALAAWGDASNRDRVTGFWRPLATRDVATIRTFVEGEVATLLANASTELQADITKLIQKLDLKTDDETFFAWLADEKRSPATRVAALNLLSSKKNERVTAAVHSALRSTEPTLRIAARDALAKSDPGGTVERIEPLLLDDDLPDVERQRAFFTLAAIASPAADEVLLFWLQGLTKRTLQEPELEIDAIEAATLRDDPELREALFAFEKERSRDNRWWRFEATLTGGNAERGRALFVGHAQAQCIRCHKVNGQGGDVGPDLSRLGAKTDRRQFRQSLLDPDAMISPGFGVISLVLDDGRVLSGTLKNETDERLEIITADGQKHVIQQSTVEQRTNPKSPMPAMEKILAPRDIRDLVEFLAEQK